MKHAYIPNPYSIYEDIFSLEPGQILQVSLSKQKPRYLLIGMLAKLLKGLTEDYRGTPNEAVKDLKNLLRHAVKSQMISDVPLGAFYQAE